MKQFKWHLVFYTGLLFTVVLMNACKSLKNLTTQPEPWSGTVPNRSPVLNDSSKKNVFIVADYKLTELFDMIAPYYLFQTTNRANVYIISANEVPILIRKNLFVKPQLTFSQVD